jgi:hypothetical protein
MQTSSHILMIRPVNFGFNPETAINNSFQVAGIHVDAHEKALHEFDSFVKLLEQNGVDVTVIEDTPEPHTPDSIFPNNWVSFHSDGTVLLYPMYAPNRRLERKPRVVEYIGKKFEIRQKIDLSAFENEGIFLEGTGSMVLDHNNRIAYACISPRTNPTALEEFCTRMHYKAVIFDAFDAGHKPVYHTNVMMCVADKYVVICLDCITDAQQRALVKQTILDSGKRIVEITMDQMNHFAGNMLQVHNNKAEKLLIMSTQAYSSLSREQIDTLKSYNRIIHSSLDTIETNGGGSARCMMAEIRLNAKDRG